MPSITWRYFKWLLILSMFPISDSTLCKKCSESDHEGVCLEHGEEENDGDRWSSGQMFSACLLVARQLQHSCKQAQQRQTAAAVQLPASPECYKRNCLQRGNWHTGTQTHKHTHTQTHTHTQACGQQQCGQHFAVTWKSLLQTWAVLKGFPSFLKLQETVQSSLKLFKTFLNNSRTHGD